MRINPGIARLQHSPTLDIHRRANELRRQGRDIVHFGFGEAPFPVPSPVSRALKANAGDTRYLPCQGLEELRESAADYLSRRFGHDAAAGRIVVGPGSKQLIFNLLQCLQGDLILPQPSWVSYAPQAHLLRKRVIWAETDPATGYRMTGDDLRCACGKSRTGQKVLILNSPCNPTGAVYEAAELKDIAEVAQRHNVIVVSDEIYAEITFARRRYRSIAAFCPDRAIVTTGLSKGFCAGGYRLGILLAPAAMTDVVPALVNLASETFTCVSAPIQHAAVAAFSGDEEVRDHVRDAAAIHRMASTYLWRRLTRIGLRCPRPEGAFYLFPDFSPFAERLGRHGIKTDVALCNDLLEKQGVAMLPGCAFGVPSDHLAVRIATVDYDGAAVLRAFRKHRPSTTAEQRAFVEANCPSLSVGVQRIEQYLDARQ